MTAKTAIAYIDGFNFYYGAVKGHPAYKWLDFPKMCHSMLPDHRLLTVRYYTARVVDRPDDPTQSQRQDVYLSALRTLPQMEIVLGQFRTRPKRVRRPNGKYVLADVTEEKGSDVNLAVDLVWDACHSAMKCALVISNDFDLQRPLNLAKRLGVEVLVANPHRHQRQRPSIVGTGSVNIRKHHLANSQLPDVVVTSDGTRLTRPPQW